MAITRKLTIAGMKGTFKLRFQDAKNQDLSFESVCGGKISVSRSTNGTTYIIECDADHFRVFTTIVTPSDFPTLFYWDDTTTYGWFCLEGFDPIDFRAGSWPSNLTADEAASSANLPELRQAEAEIPVRGGCGCC